MNIVYRRKIKNRKKSRSDRNPRFSLRKKFQYDALLSVAVHHLEHQATPIATKWSTTTWSNKLKQFVGKIEIRVASKRRKFHPSEISENIDQNQFAF